MFRRIWNTVIVLLLIVIICCEILYENKRMRDMSNSIPYQSSVSQNKTNQIESRVIKGEMPDLYINGRPITNNEMGIEYTPQINDKGDYAYAYFEESNSKSEIVLNRSKIYEGGICYVLALTNSYLVFSNLDLEKNVSTLYKYNLNKKEMTPIFDKTGIYFKEASILNDEEILLQSWGDSNKTGVNLIDLVSGIEKKLDIQENADLLEAYANVDGYTLITASGNRNGKYLLNAIYNYYKFQYGEPFSAANDFAGRISWNESARLEGLIEICKKTGNKEVEATIVAAVENILSVRNEYLGINTVDAPKFLWSTKKYSLDQRTPRSDLVDNGQILYSLLKAANYNIVSDETKDKIIHIAEQAYDYFNEQYDGKGHYTWRKGSCFYLDGIELPWNQQNDYALSLIELYKLTSNDKYYKRIKDLMSTFKVEWIINQDNTIMWHYWPLVFYEGWDEQDNKSINTPKREEQIDKVLEDTVHAAINAKFIMEYHNTFDDGLITSSDLAGVKKAMDYFCSKDGFNANISGLGKEGSKSYLSLPGVWWVEYENQYLADLYSNLGHFAYPDFDYSILYRYASLYDENEEISLTIAKDVYSLNGTLRSSSSEQIYSIDAAFDYVEEIIRRE